MGAQVSRVYGFVVRRPLQRFNVEHRAEKMIKKFEDPAALPHRAPMYKSDAAVLEEFRRENPDLIALEGKKDDPLHDRLKAVYVSSTDPAPDPRLGETENKPLPRDVRQHYDDFVPAQMRVERSGQTRTLPRGKVSINQAVDMLTRHSKTEGVYGVEEISEEYRLNKEVVTNTVKYFSIFSMMETKTRENEGDRPDPLAAGPDWEKPDDMKLQDAEKKQVLADMTAKSDQHKLRAADEMRRKSLETGEDRKT